MIGTKEAAPPSAQFMEVFVDDAGAFRWKTDQLNYRSTETADVNWRVWLQAGFDCYEDPYITLVLSNEKIRRGCVAVIGSTAINWINPAGDGYETPLEEVDGLQVEIESDDWGLRRYFAPDDAEKPVTVSFWRLELRDETDPDSQGDWSTPEAVESESDSFIRSLVKNSLQTAHQLVG